MWMALVKSRLSYLLWLWGSYLTTEGVLQSQVLLAYFLVWYHNVMIRKWGLFKSADRGPLDSFAAIMQQITSYSIMHVAM